MFLVERTGVLLRFRVGLHAATEPWGWGNRRTIPRARFTGGHAQVCPLLSTFLLQGGYLRFSLQILINILSEISVTFFVDSPFVLVPRAVLDVRGVLLACTSKQRRCSCVADPHHPKQCSIWEFQILRSLSDLKNAENKLPFYSIDLSHWTPEQAWCSLAGVPQILGCVNTIFDRNTNTIVTIGPLLAVFFYDASLAGFPALNYF